MALQPFSNEQLNYFKFVSIVLNEFAAALRQTFKSMWDSIYGHRLGYQLWDDSTVVRNLFVAEEGGKTKVPTHISYEEWDCTALFQATIYARSFATPDSKGHYRTLGELYARCHKVPPGNFHASVVSPSGNKAETFALAIDQLRLLRNSLCHSDRSEIDKLTFDRYVQLAKEAFKALGIKTDPINVIDGLTESDFPTKEVRRLEEALRQETRSYIECLEEVKSGVDELLAQGNALKEKVEDLAVLEQKLDDLKQNMNQDHTDSNSFLPPSNLPSKIPQFTGRQRECEEISSHLTSKGTRIVSIWGSPGFGKTSVATTVGHQLQSGGLPVYFFSMRGLRSKAELTWKVLSFFRRHSSKDQIPQRMSIDDELSLFLSKISDDVVMILDNADDLLESGVPNGKEDFISFLEVILNQVENTSFLITTRESLEFLDVHFQGHHTVRIRPLDGSFSQSLVDGLLTSVTTSDCSKIAKICGNVPLAMKLLCSSISEDSAEPSQFLKDLEESTERDVFDLLDKPDYPSNLRLKFLFETSFARLSSTEKEALISLCVLSQDFNISVAAAVLDVKSSVEAKKVLHTLRRKSLLDSSCKPDLFSMHKLLLLFAKEKGDGEMKETMLNSKARLSAFYVSLFEKLNEQFLTGYSMQAFIDFFEQKDNIIQSLMESCSDPMTCDVAFTVLIRAEVFLDSLFWCEEENIDKLYESVTKEAQKFGKCAFYSRLLLSLAFTEVTLGIHGRTMMLLVEADNLTLSVNDKAKLLCYRGICQLASEKTSDGVQNVQEGLSLIGDSAEEQIIKVTALQILVTYFRFHKKREIALELYMAALQECRALGDISLLVIPPLENRKLKIIEGEKPEPDSTNSGPLRLEMICVVSEATKQFSDDETKVTISNSVLQILKETGNPSIPNSTGLWNFQRNVNNALSNVTKNPKAAVKLCDKRIGYHKMTLKQSGKLTAKDDCKPDDNLDLNLHQVGLLKNYLDHGCALYKMRNYSEAIQSYQCALNIAVRLFGEEHSDTAQSYFSLGQTQHALGNFSSALQSKQRSLDIRVKLFGKENAKTAQSYFSLGVTQHALGDFSSALTSKQRSLHIGLKLLGEDHIKTAQGYFSLGQTQHALSDFSSALQSKQHALKIRVKLFGEEHLNTAEIYSTVGVTQHALSDFSSALQSFQRALDIRVKLFGEENANTARSYFSLGITQHALGDFSSALKSKQRSLRMRLKLYGEEHTETARSYFSLGVTQHSFGNFSSALQSKQRSLDIRVKLFGEEHSDTVQSYFSLGETQHALGIFSSALQSKQRALDIRVKLFGEEHTETAESHFSLGETQHALGDFSSALQSFQCALDIRVKLFGEGHKKTAESYVSLGVTQHALGDFSSALQSKQRSLHVRVDLFGEEHLDTAESYFTLGVTQRALDDLSSALQSSQRALDIRVKILGDKDPDTAESYFSLGVTQLQLGDFSSALKSFQCNIDINLR